MAKKAGLTYHLEEKAAPYREALMAAGLEIVDITPEHPRGLDGLDALVISGGPDIDPAWYGAERHPLAQEHNKERDALEWDLVMAALGADLPLLCICRGMQLLNVAHRGSLRQHMEDHQNAHTIMVEPDTVLAGIVGAGDHEVNSRHHQAVVRLGEGLVVAARAADGVIEAIERKGKRFVVGVQWHPEDRVLTDEKDRKLFEALAKAADGR